MGCAPSIHISENRAVYHGGKEAEDAPGPAAPPPLPPGGPRFPHGPKTAASARARGASLAESEPRGSGGNQVRGARQAAGGSGAAVRRETQALRGSRFPAGPGGAPSRAAVPSCRALDDFDGPGAAAEEDRPGS